MRNSNVCHRPTNAAAREWLRIALLGGLWPLWAAGQEVSVDCLLGPDRVAEVGSPVTGVVEFVWVERGDRVSAGQKLATLKTDVEEASVSVARARAGSGAEVRTAQANHEFALQKLARAEDLERQGFVSQQALDQLRTEVKVAAQRLALAGDHQQVWRAEHELARRQLARRTIRAPFDGVVAELTIEQGEWITPSPPGIPMPAVLDLLDPDAIYVSAPLDEVDRGRVAVDLPVRITLDAYPGKSFAGKIARIAPYILDVAEQSRTFEVEATFEDAQFARTLPPGASADVEVILSVSEGVVRIPTYALAEGKRVLVVESECPSQAGLGARLASLLLAHSGECLVARDVTAGLKNWEFVEIREGLKEGERIVVSLDRAEVKEGARVRQSAVAER